MSDKTLEQRINNNFCGKIGESASETLALLTVFFGDYAMKKPSVFEWHRLLKEGREFVQKRKRQIQIRTEYEIWCAEIED
jgi:hypothetical protein